MALRAMLELGGFHGPNVPLPLSVRPRARVAGQGKGTFSMLKSAELDRS